MSHMPRSNLARTLQVYSVKDYGAIGDGVADDTEAIQEAIDDTEGRILYFPKGKYLVTSTLSITTGTRRLVGTAGNRYADGGTEITYSGTGPLFEIGSDNGNPYTDADYDGPQDHWFEHLWLSHSAPATPLNMGGTTGNYKAGAYGIRDWRGGGIRIYNCGIERFEYNFWGVQSDINDFNTITSLYSRYGIWAGPRCDQWSIKNLLSFFCDQALVVDGYVSQLRLIDAQIVGCGTATLYPIEIRRGTSSVRIVRPWFEHLAGQGYTGVNQVGFVGVGLADGYNGNSGACKGITVEHALVATTAAAQPHHARCMVGLGKALGVRVHAPISPVGYSDNGNLDALVIAPSGTSFTKSESFAIVTGTFPYAGAAAIVLNEGTGTPGLNYVADVGPGELELYGHDGVLVTGPLRVTGALTGVGNVQVNGNADVDGTLTVDGNSTFVGNVDARSGFLFVGASGAQLTYVKNDEINFRYQTNAGAVGYINFSGYQAGLTQFRSLIVADGKGSTLATFAGDTASVVLAKAFGTSNELAPAQITSNQNDYAPTGIESASVLVLTTDASRDLTGIYNTLSGRWLYVYNNGTQNLVLKHEVTSTAAYQIRGRGGADTTLTPKTGALLYYSPSITKWLVMSDTL